MQLTVLPDLTEARVIGVPRDALVSMAIGLDRGRVTVPGGAVLDLVPISMSPSVNADQDGRALLQVRYVSGSSAGLEFLAQAVVHDPHRPAGSAGACTTMPVQQGRVPEVGDEADLVVFFGQDNCEGRAAIEDLPVELRGPHPNLRIWDPAIAEWEAVEAGKNTSGTPDAPFFGAEIGMADTIAARARPLWLVKMAASSSSLGSLPAVPPAPPPAPAPGPGNEWGSAAGALYAVMMQRIERAAAAVRALGLVPRVRLVCMMQGESDAFSPALANAYADNLRLLCTQLRSDLRCLGLSNGELPTIRIGLVNLQLVGAGVPGTLAVRAAQSAVADALPNCEAIETSALPLSPDRIHFAAGGLVQMGRRFLAGGW